MEDKIYVNDEVVDTDNLKLEISKVVHIDALISETKNAIKPLQERLKVLRLERKELEKSVCNVMSQYNFYEVELASEKSKIIYNNKKAVVPITRKSIKERMILFFEEGPGSLLNFNSKKPDAKGNDMYDYIYSKDNREYIQKEEVKINKIS